MAVRHTEAIAEDVERVLGAALPAIDVVDVKVVPGGVLRVLIDHPERRRSRALRRGRTRTRRLPRALRARGLVPRHSAPAHQARALRTFHRPRGRFALPRRLRGRRRTPRRAARERLRSASSFATKTAFLRFRSRPSAALIWLRSCRCPRRSSTPSASSPTRRGSIPRSCSPRWRTRCWPPTARPRTRSRSRASSSIARRATSASSRSCSRPRSSRAIRA